MLAESLLQLYHGFGVSGFRQKQGQSLAGNKDLCLLIIAVIPYNSREGGNTLKPL
jgi:hypothetical protein